MSAFTPFYRGFIVVGGIPMPVLPNASFSCPMNFALPPTVGNLWQYDYGQGLRQPVIDISLVVRSNITEALASTFLNFFVNRSADNSYDASYIGYSAGGGPPPPLNTSGGGSYGKLDVTDGITFWDGASGFQMTGAKAASFTISTSKGDDLRFTCRFMGTGIQPLSLATGYPAGNNRFSVTGTTAISPVYNAPTSAFNVLRFKSLLLGTYTSGAFAPFPGGLDGLRNGGAYNISLTYNNNLTPDLGLNGTEFPSGLNAGQQTVSLNYTLQASDTAFLDNYNTTSNAAAPLAIGIAAIKQATPGTFVPGSDLLRTFVLNNLLDNTPNEQAMSAPRVMRQHSLIGLGSTANSTANPALTGPLTIY